MLPWSRFYRKEENGRYSLLNYDDFCARMGRQQRLLRRGILDVFMAQHNALRTTSDGQLHGVKVFSRPVVLENSIASRLLSASVFFCPQLSIASLPSLTANAPFSFWVETPDGCAANERKQQATKERPGDKCGVISSRCAAHQVVRSVISSEKMVAGDIYALWLTCTQVWVHCFA